MEKPSNERTLEDIEVLVTLMIKQPLFEGVQSNHDRRQIARALQSTKVPPQTKIFECGDIGREVYSILRGTVAMKVPQPNGEMKKVGVLAAPEYFGERAFQKGNGQQRTATLASLDEEVHALTVKGDDLDPDVLRRLISSVLPNSNAESGYEDGNTARQRWKATVHKVRSGHSISRIVAEDTVAESGRGFKTIPESTALQSRSPDDVETSAMLFDPNDLLLSASKLWQTSPRLTALKKVNPSPTTSLDSDAVRGPELAGQISDDTQPPACQMPGTPAGPAPRNGRHRLSTRWKRDELTATFARSTTALGRPISVDLAQRQDRQPSMVDEGRGVIEVANPCRRLLVVRAQSLRNADKIGKSDPYAVVYFDNRRVGQTKTMRNTVDPRWDAEFELLDVDKQSVLKIMVRAASRFCV